MSITRLVTKAATNSSMASNVSLFLKALRSDIGILMEKDIPHKLVLPGPDPVTGRGLDEEAVDRCRRAHKLRILKQAVHKQIIRDSLWPRLNITFWLASFITVPMLILGVIVWLGALLARPEIAVWFSPFHWIQPWLLRNF